jgi:hypothetical protein
MSIAREIRINRIQNKNRMTGQTFNPSGITSQQIKDRERDFVLDMQSKTQQERQAYWMQSEEVRKDWNHSYPWEWAAFTRNFIFNGQVN